LLDFSNSSNSPAFIVRNFSRSPRCERQRDSEFDETVKNRDLYRIEASSIGDLFLEVEARGIAFPCSVSSR
jgi:hypothetical protein